MRNVTVSPIATEFCAICRFIDQRSATVALVLGSPIRSGRLRIVRFCFWAPGVGLSVTRAMWRSVSSPKHGLKSYEKTRELLGSVTGPYSLSNRTIRHTRTIFDEAKQHRAIARNCARRLPHFFNVVLCNFLLADRCAIAASLGSRRLQAFRLQHPPRLRRGKQRDHRPARFGVAPHSPECRRRTA